MNRRAFLRNGAVFTTGALLSDRALARPLPDDTITISFELASDEIVMQHRTRKIRVRLRGDEVIGMDNFGADATFGFAGECASINVDGAAVGNNIRLCASPDLSNRDGG